MVRQILDVSRADDRHTAHRLATEPVIWLGTTRADNRPHRAPVWFCWDDPRILVFSIPGTVKLANIRRLPQVALSLDSADGGRDIVLAEGSARLADDGPGDDWADGFAGVVSGFADKYTPLLAGSTFADWRRQFSVPVLITVTRVVAWTRENGELRYRSAP